MYINIIADSRMIVPLISLQEETHIQLICSIDLNSRRHWNICFEVSMINIQEIIVVHEILNSVINSFTVIVLPVLCC